MMVENNMALEYIIGIFKNANNPFLEKLLYYREQIVDVCVFG